MAITTDTGKLAVMEWDLDWEPGLPLSPGALDPADQQQLLWGFPEDLWGEAETVAPGRVVCLTGADRSTTALTGADRSVTTWTVDLDC